MGICPVSCFGRELLWQGGAGHGDKTRLGLFSRRAVLHKSDVKTSLPKCVEAAPEGPGAVISVWKQSDLRVVVGST